MLTELIIDLTKVWDDLLRPVPFMSLAKAKSELEEMARCETEAQKTEQMRSLIIRWKSETDEPPLRGLLTGALLNKLDKAYQTAYKDRYSCSGVDTTANEVTYSAYTTEAVKVLRLYCQNRLEDKDGDPLSDAERVVLRNLPAKAKVWMTCHPHLLLSDHVRMPLLTGSLLQTIVVGLLRMIPALNEVSCSSHNSMRLEPSGINVPNGDKPPSNPLEGSRELLILYS